MNILITGGAGYIGSKVALDLINKNHRVFIVDNLISGKKLNIPKKCTFYKCDISNRSKILRIIEKNKIETVFHFAALISVGESIKRPKTYIHNNYNKSKIFLNSCIKKKIKNFIFSSTAAAYGDPINDDPIKEDNLLKPLNPYGESKIKTESYLQNELNCNYIILRYFNVAGADPQMRSGLISKKPTHLIKIASEVAVGKRDEITIFGSDYSTPDGTAIRDYIHVSDLANVHVKAVEYLFNKQKSNIINCGYGKGFSVKEVLNVFNEVNDQPISIKTGERRAGDSSMLVSNVSKLHNLFDWKPKYNDLAFIIKTAIQWEKKLLNK